MKGKFSKFVWLLLIAAFAAIVAGGCGGGGGSSSNNGGDVDGNVMSLGKADHPLYDALKKHYVEMPNGTIFIGKNITREELEAAADELRAAYEGEKIIGMYAPTQARIDDLHDVLGIDNFRKLTADEIAAAAADLKTGLPDAEEIEFYMIKQHDGLLFQNRQHYVGKGTPGAEFYQSGPLEISGDMVISGDDTPVSVEPLGDKSEAYPQIAAAVASWNGRVAEYAVKVKAESASAHDAIRAAAGSDRLDALAKPIINTAHFTFADQDCDEGLWFGSIYESGVEWHHVTDDTSSENKECRFKFPTVEITATMYSCYSFQEDANYYLVVMNAGMNNEKNYHHWIWTNTDYEQNAARRYFSKPAMQFVSDPNDKKKLQLLDHQPWTKDAPYVSSVNWNVSGIGFIGNVSPQGATEQVNLGVADRVEISRSKQFDIKDYIVQEHKNGANPWTEYLFDLPGLGTRHLSYTALKAASKASRNFNSEEFWIWRVARSEKKAYSFAHNFTYDLLMMRGPTGFGIMFYDSKTWEARAVKGYAIHLPIPPTLALSTYESIVDPSGRTLDFSLFSDGDWELSCDGDWGGDADWVVIDDSDRKGGSTKDTIKRDISVTILENTSRYTDRKATITVTGTPDPNGKPQTAKFEIIQGHAR